MFKERSKPKDYKMMSYQELESDPKYLGALDQAALEFLTTEDAKYFNEHFTGELDNAGYLIRKDGGKPINTPSMCIGGGEPMERTAKRAKEIIREQLGS